MTWNVRTRTETSFDLCNGDEVVGTFTHEDRASEVRDIMQARDDADAAERAKQEAAQSAKGHAVVKPYGDGFAVFRVIGGVQADSPLSAFSGKNAERDAQRAADYYNES